MKDNAINLLPYSNICRASSDILYQLMILIEDEHIENLQPVSSQCDYSSTVIAHNCFKG